MASEKYLKDIAKQVYAEEGVPDDVVSLCSWVRHALAEELDLRDGRKVFAMVKEIAKSEQEGEGCVWVLLKRTRKPELLVLCCFSTEDAAKQYAYDVLGLGDLGFEAHKLEKHTVMPVESVSEGGAL